MVMRPSRYPTAAIPNTESIRKFAALMVALISVLLYFSLFFCGMDLSGVVRQQLRGKAVIRHTGLLLFGLKRGHVVQRQRADGYGLRLLGGVLTRVAAKNR